jgi:anaerobic selenocysteine-containing dehydrogenase
LSARWADVALAPGIMHILIADDLLDRDCIERHWYHLPARDDFAIGAELSKLYLRQCDVLK